MMTTLKSLIRRWFYRSEFCRLVVGWASILAGRTQALGISHLLSYADADALGPLQRDEAIALFGLVRTLRPKTVVEFGFFHGHSAFNFLRALDRDARLYSYDLSDDSARRARRELSFDPRLKFVHKSQVEFEPGDVDRRPVEFVFFDAAHELDLNIEAFRRVLPCLAPAAVLVIHDTGLWAKAHFSSVQTRWAEIAAGRWVTDDLYAHQPDERVFVDWVTANHPDFNAIHFHSTNTLRHGFTLLQVKTTLSGAGLSMGIQPVQTF